MLCWFLCGWLFACLFIGLIGLKGSSSSSRSRRARQGEVLLFWCDRLREDFLDRVKFSSTTTRVNKADIILSYCCCCFCGEFLRFKCYLVFVKLLLFCCGDVFAISFYKFKGY